ncbi:MAG TPA: DNA/RNA non-specific endonuclease [Allosphingosinicella sp.]|nr:DNA/RNA non-specific endonuclease [Allosphingosinicella sp.]
MANEERLERVRARITDELAEIIRLRTLAGELPAPLAAAVSQAALERFQAGTASLESVGDLAALEAIVKRFGRPPMLIRGGEIEIEPLPPEFPAGTDVLIKGAQKWVPSVGRIEFVNHSMAWGGTGFVIDRRNGAHIVATNRHVAKKVARRRADGRAVFIRSPAGALYGARIDFNEEIDAAEDDSRTAPIAGLEYLADDLSADVALLRVEAAGFDMPDPMELAGDEAATGDLVALIGYPAYDSRNDDQDQARYFRDLYEVKRFAPGFVMQGISGGSQLLHDCTSLGGNSGSPLIDLHGGKVVGLHFSGKYGENNAAVGVTTLARLLKGNLVTAGEALAAAREESAGDGHHQAPHFEGRQGFDLTFLGANAATPWPVLPDWLAEGLATPSDAPAGDHELRYTHFGVKYSGSLKLPLITAVNIDGEQPVRIKRSRDKWFTDGRLPIEIQLRDRNFADPQIDRGHMVRREDPNWGSQETAETANFDTFHYVNACAQHSAMNQGKQLWQGLENYILDSSRTHGFRACVFTGPVLRDPQSPDEEIVVDGAIAPLEFWKLVATLDAQGRTLHATAYLLSQGQMIRDLLEKRSRREAMEGFELGAYRTFQIAIADLQAATGYDFGPYLEADPLAKTEAGNEALASGEPLFVAIDEPDNLVLGLERPARRSHTPEAIMRTEYDPVLKAELSFDEDERLRQVVAQEPQPMAGLESEGPADPGAAASELIARLADRLGLDAGQLENIEEPVAYDLPADRGIELHKAQERPLFDSTTYGYRQTYLNVPIWGAGLTVTVKNDTAAPVNLTNDTSIAAPDAVLPPEALIDRWRDLFGAAVSAEGLEAVAEAQRPAAGEEGPAGPAEHPTATFVRSLVAGDEGAEAPGEGTLGPAGDNAKLIRGRFFIYRYRADRRTAADELAARRSELAERAAQSESAGEEPYSRQEEEPLVLPLPPVPPEIRDGDWCLVAEVTFRLTTAQHGDLVWLALVEVETGAVLYLRAMASGVNGMVFLRDPITMTGVATNMPNSTDAVLNPLRKSVPLLNLDPPSNGQQKLRGTRVEVIDQEPPAIQPPTVGTGQSFDFNARTDDFAAVSAYVHSDNVFRVIEGLGFPIASYFNATNFPIPVDHRGLGSVINAHCVGNGVGGIGHCCYALNDTTNLANPIGRACDSRVHWHELCGHGILYEHVNWPNFKFAHSAGDSLSIIYHDPDSKAPDRYRYAPWHPTLARRCDRPVNGWGWGGANDDRGYGSEEILATCLFRVYEAIGGSSANPNSARRRFCSQLMMYLILRTVSTFTPATNPATPEAFANAMIATDLLNWTTHNVFGGAYNKVIRWSFEKQGVWRRPGDPLTGPGQPPLVDIYIDDGRQGEYGYRRNYSNNVSVWNRRAADGLTTHQQPKAGAVNFAYVKIRNRGTQPAQNVTVRGFQGNASSGLIWPGDFAPLTTPQIAVPGGVAANNAQTVTVGPFSWTPSAGPSGKLCLLMVAEATGDRSNLMHFSAGETIEDWRLTPNDNNVGQRAMTPSP